MKICLILVQTIKKTIKKISVISVISLILCWTKSAPIAFCIKLLRPNHARIIN